MGSGGLKMAKRAQEGSGGLRSCPGLVQLLGGSIGITGQDWPGPVRTGPGRSRPLWAGPVQHSWRGTSDLDHFWPFWPNRPNPENTCFWTPFLTPIFRSWPVLAKVVKKGSKRGSKNGVF